MVSARARSRVKRRKTIHDIGEIVLGVLIALGLGAVASEIGWEIDVWRAKRAIANELGEIVGQGQERQKIDSCIEGKLDAVGAIIERAAGSGRLPAVGKLGDPPFRTWSSGVWDATRSAQIASQMERGLQDDLSGTYRFVDILGDRSSQEVDAWSRLYTIVGPGRAVSDAELIQLRADLTAARNAHRQILMATMFVNHLVRKLELPVNHETARQYGSGPTSQFCGPNAPYAGERYGAAPFGDLRENLGRILERSGVATD